MKQEAAQWGGVLSGFVADRWVFCGPVSALSAHTRVGGAEGVHFSLGRVYGVNKPPLLAGRGLLVDRVFCVGGFVGMVVAVAVAVASVVRAPFPSEKRSSCLRDSKKKQILPRGLRISLPAVLHAEVYRVGSPTRSLK